MGDITLDALFRARRSASLPNNQTVYIRALSDAERRQKQLASLRASITLDDKLADETSDEYAVYLSTLKKLSRDELLQILEQWKRGDATEAVYRESEAEYIPFPDNPTSDETKQVLKAREASEKALDERRTKSIAGLVETYMSQANKWDDATLLKEAISRKKALVSLEAVVNEDMYQCLYFGVRNEDDSRFFPNIEAVRSLSTQLLVFLLEQQREVDSINIWEVTKSGHGRPLERVVDDDEAPGTEPS